MSYTIAELAQALGAEAEGAVDLRVTHAAEPASAGPEALAMAMSRVYIDDLARGGARAALLPPGVDWRALGLEAAIFAPRTRLAMAGVTQAFDPGPQIAPGIHPSAVIDPSATIGAGAAIGPLVVIGAGAIIGARARIAPHVSIGAGVSIGEDALIHAGVRIGDRVRIGARFIAQPNAVIGGDGFSFVTPEKSGIEEIRETLGQRGAIAPQSWRRIHSLGAVTIGDDVEVGATSCIDRGTIADTTVGDGTKIDNHVQIGHNCTVGRDCLFCGHAAISGSVKVGDRVVLAGRAGVGDNLSIGDDAILTAGCGVITNVPPGRVLAGAPSMPLEQHMASYKALRRLPRLVERVAQLQKLVSNGGDRK
jgi:UDP-3-O-[3-hydroxymyristoyl] glucosamine N-acyltransferase